MLHVSCGPSYSIVSSKGLSLPPWSEASVENEDARDVKNGEASAQNPVRHVDVLASVQLGARTQCLIERSGP